MAHTTTESLYRITLEGLERMDKLEDTLRRIEGQDKQMSKATGITAFTTALSAGMQLWDRFSGRVEQGVRAIEGATKDLINTASSFETLNVQFETLLGSETAAVERMDELAKFSAWTPFDIEPVAQASRILQTFGGTVLATGDNLTMVGDMAASVNTDFGELSTWVARAYDALQSGRPWGEAALRLQELGIMSGQTRARLEDMTKEGATGAQVWAEFSRVMTENFGGGMARLAVTSKGLLSTIRGDMSLIKKSIAEEGLFDVWKANLEGVLSILGEIQSGGQTQTIGQAIAVAGVKVSDVFWNIAIAGASLADFLGIVGSESERRKSGQEEIFPPPASGLQGAGFSEERRGAQEVAKGIAGWLKDIFTSEGPMGPPELDTLADDIRKAKEETDRKFAVILNALAGDRSSIMGPPVPTPGGGSGGGGLDLSALMGGAEKETFGIRERSDGWFGPPEPTLEALDLVIDKTMVLEEVSITGMENISTATFHAYDTMKQAGVGGYAALMDAARRAGATESLSRVQVSEVAKYAAKATAASGIEALGQLAEKEAAFYAAKALGAAFTNPAAAVGYLAAAAGMAALSAGATMVSSSIMAGAEREYGESLPGNGSAYGGGYGSTSGGSYTTGSRSSLPITAQAAGPQNINYNIYVQHYGATVYGSGGVKELWDEELMPLLQDATSNGEI